MARYIQPPTPPRPPVLLELTAEEAEWLLGILQNPVGCAPPDEPPFDRTNRCEIWTALYAGLGA